ncbi:hypothetical protein C8R47DRAFT_1075641 [Mycena vitilis]|nr:hypothetical protein C8R47DRAFT_1075641 [Mycena vitilis]
MPIRSVRVERADTGEQSELYYCTTCDNCPICNSPPAPAQATTRSPPPPYTAAPGPFLVTFLLRLVLTVFPDNEHRVLVKDRAAHRRELAEMDGLCKDMGDLELQQQADGGVDGVNSAVGGLTLKEASDLTTALAMTDSGPNLSQQPCKLWTSRSEFQDLRAPFNPTAFNPVSMQEAHASVNSLLAESSHSKPAKPAKKVELRNTSILGELSKKLAVAKQTIEVESHFDMDDDTQVAEMRSRVKSALQMTLSVEKSLEKIPESPQKEQITSDLRTVEIKINLIGTVLPPETTPVQYDACMYFTSFF